MKRARRTIRGRRKLSEKDLADRRLARGAAAVVGFVFDMPPEAFFRTTRGAAGEAEARQIMLAVKRRAAVIAEEETSIQRLGKGIGRDRTSVAHALHKIEQACEGSPDSDVMIHKLAEITAALIHISAVTTEAVAQGIAAAIAADVPDTPDPIVVRAPPMPSASRPLKHSHDEIDTARRTARGKRARGI